MASPKEAPRSFELSGRITPQTFVERFSYFIEERNYNIYDTSPDIKIDRPYDDGVGYRVYLAAQRMIESLEDIREGSFFLQHPETLQLYFLKCGYEYLENQIHYSAVLTKVPKDLAVENLAQLEDLTPKLSFHHRINWGKEGDPHILMAVPTSAELDFVGDDILLAEFFEYLVTAIP